MAAAPNHAAGEVLVELSKIEKPARLSFQLQLIQGERERETKEKIGLAAFHSASLSVVRCLRLRLYICICI